MTAPLTIRPGTSDQTVFRDIWFREKYKPDIDISPKAVLDLGAYTGISTRYFQKLWPDATVIAVEPDPRSATLLRLNAPTAEIYEVALGEHSHDIESFALHPEPWKSSFGRGETTVSVITKTVPAILNGRQPQVVKIDIEGSEREVLGGSCDWVDGVKIIFVETHDRFFPGCKAALNDLLDKQPRDYRMENRGGEDYMIVFDDAAN